MHIPVYLKYLADDDQMESLESLQYDDRSIAHGDARTIAMFESLLSLHLELTENNWHHLVAVLLPDGRMLVADEQWDIARELMESEPERRVEVLRAYMHDTILLELAEKCGLIGYNINAGIESNKHSIQSEIALALQQGNHLSFPYSSMVLGNMLYAAHHADDYPFTLWHTAFEHWPALDFTEYSDGVQTVYLVFDLHV